MAVYLSQVDLPHADPGADVPSFCGAVPLPEGLTPADGVLTVYPACAGSGEPEQFAIAASLKGPDGPDDPPCAVSVTNHGEPVEAIVAVVFPDVQAGAEA